MQPAGGGRGGAGGDYDAAPVGEEGDGEGRTRVEVLADEEVAVVKGGGCEADEEFVGFGGGLGDFCNLETGVEKGRMLVSGGWRSGGYAGGSQNRDGAYG